MKKINLSEAENIVGGTFVCTKEFAWVGGGNNRTCQLVTTCADKFGGVKKTYHRRRWRAALPRRQSRADAS
ncbi:DUF4762 family protein [Serratia sp. EWG9]|uniref:DUF4762 family protein n=1 Tax=Serratia sp. EWG9 TaxID=2785628 RepID=UPI002105C3B7|nr:DUF4762 family protein [Serratia sp. EWG9]